MPATLNPPPLRCASYQQETASNAMCGSLATIGIPEWQCLPATTQLLLPMPSLSTTSLSSFRRCRPRSESILCRCACRVGPIAQSRASGVLVRSICPCLASSGVPPSHASRYKQNYDAPDADDALATGAEG